MRILVLFCLFVSTLLLSQCGSSGFPDISGDFASKYRLNNCCEINTETNICLGNDVQKNTYFFEVTNGEYKIIDADFELQINTNYELDRLQTSSSITILELFIRQAGVNSSKGFFISKTSEADFKHIDLKSISETAESIQLIKILKGDKIEVKLFSLDSKNTYISEDFGLTWLLK